MYTRILYDQYFLHKMLISCFMLKEYTFIFMNNIIQHLCCYLSQIYSLLGNISACFQEKREGYDILRPMRSMRLDVLACFMLQWCLVVQVLMQFCYELMLIFDTIHFWKANNSLESNKYIRRNFFRNGFTPFAVIFQNGLQILCFLIFEL